jgi:predicted nucleic acid-binding protein
MRSVFADTFYWAALTSTEDAAHERAIFLYEPKGAPAARDTRDA